MNGYIGTLGKELEFTRSKYKDQFSAEEREVLLEAALILMRVAGYLELDTDYDRR